MFTVCNINLEGIRRLIWQGGMSSMHLECMGLACSIHRYFDV